MTQLILHHDRNAESVHALADECLFVMSVAPSETPNHIAHSQEQHSSRTKLTSMLALAGQV